MGNIKLSLITAVFGVISLLAMGAQAQPGQQNRSLSLTPSTGLPIIPIFEGWIANEDGSRTFSFGFINRATEGYVELPLGEANYMEPAEYSGNQPTHFPAGRHTGVFAVTVPAEEADIDVWWYLTSPGEETLKVPGRASASAYELDFIRPRPQGSLQPRVGFGNDGEQQPGLFAQVSNFALLTEVGEPLEITANMSDPADRDPTDPRFGEPLPINVGFFKHQGPGEVSFTRHESTPEPVNPYDPKSRRYARWSPPSENELQVLDGAGQARVYATFSEPGDYMVRIKADVHDAPDSSNGDQCCWTNVFQRVTVNP